MAQAFKVLEVIGLAFCAVLIVVGLLLMGVQWVESGWDRWSR